MDETLPRGNENMGLPKLAPYSGHSTFFTKCWPEKENPYRCHFLAQVKVKNLTLYHVNEFVIWKLIIRNKEEMKLELGITIPKLTVSKKNCIDRFLKFLHRRKRK